jgi:Fur family ferric uptake transcriptional regulator
MPPSDLPGELRAAGLRATAPRVAVLAHLRAAAMPCSHPEVVEVLHDRGWDRATLYRNLTDLVRVGLARRTDLGDRVWRFEAADRAASHTHPHFVCDACGEVTCLTDVTVDVHGGQGAPAAVRREAVEVQLRGCCDRCEGRSA